MRYDGWWTGIRVAIQIFVKIIDIAVVKEMLITSSRQSIRVGIENKKRMKLRAERAAMRAWVRRAGRRASTRRRVQWARHRRSQCPARRPPFRRPCRPTDRLLSSPSRSPQASSSSSNSCIEKGAMMLLQYAQVQQYNVTRTSHTLGTDARHVTCWRSLSTPTNKIGTVGKAFVNSWAAFEMIYISTVHLKLTFRVAWRIWRMKQQCTLDSETPSKRWITNFALAFSTANFFASSTT